MATWRKTDEEVPKNDCEVWLYWAHSVSKGYFELKRTGRLNNAFTIKAYTTGHYDPCGNFEHKVYDKLVNPSHWMPICMPDPPEKE